jgi:hypothetical protein
MVSGGEMIFKFLCKSLWYAAAESTIFEKTVGLE